MHGCIVLFSGRRFSCVLTPDDWAKGRPDLARDRPGAGTKNRQAVLQRRLGPWSADLSLLLFERERERSGTTVLRPRLYLCENIQLSCNIFGEWMRSGSVLRYCT